MNDTTKPTEHFFGTSAFNWATGASRAEVLAKLGRMTGANEMKLQVKVNGGLYAWTCRVLAPADAQYEINGFKPRGVDTDRAQAFKLVNIKGHCVPDDESES